MTVPACDQSTSGSFHTETLGSSPRSRKASGRACSSASRSGSSAHVAKVTIGSDTQPTLPDGDCADHAQAQVDQIRARVKSARIRPNLIRDIRNACRIAPKRCDASGPGESDRGPHFVASDVVPENEKPRSLAAAERCSYTAWDSNPEPTD